MRKPPRPPKPVAERLAAKLVPGPNGCVVWTGATVPFGHGMIAVDHTGRLAYVHRVAWESVHGPIPDGLFVLHRCDNPPCCNVEHLFLGSQADNIADMVSKGRARGRFGPW